MGADLMPGTRIRVKASSPWPERVWCLGTVVAAPNDGIYPQPAKDEVLVHLDDDPLKPQSSETRFWTCVFGLKHVEVLAP